MQGLDVPYVPGWDCHGLPIEQQVEKKYGKAKPRKTLGCLENDVGSMPPAKLKNNGKILYAWVVLGDWQNPYLSMAFDTEADILRTLGTLLGKGYLKQGHKPVHWCLECGSALAEAEVEYHDKVSKAVDVAFAVQDTHNLNEKLQLETDTASNIVIWTTTPWTLPANQAVALHPGVRLCSNSPRHSNLYRRRGTCRTMLHALRMGSHCAMYFQR